MGFQAGRDRPLVQAEIEDQIIRLSAELEKAGEEQAEQAVFAAHAKANWEKARAKARLLSKYKTSDDKEADAVLQTELLMEESMLSAAIYDAKRIRVRRLETQLEALRTLSANVRGQT